MKTCYDCAHHPLCKFRDGIQTVVHNNISMVDVDLPGSSPKSWLRLFDALAAACKYFEKDDA